ncbi:MAG TPA: aminoacyl-tRNA hydrolase [Bryobacteraceae bacterium]|jgi:PTH1 family peptidyl-tRNA hydrolase
MWLLAGLGNPGGEYADTPHNLGFLVADVLAARQGVRITRPECMALVGPGQIGGQAVLLAKPQTFMNLSGTSLKPLMSKHEIAAENLILVYDDLDLPWGHIRVRPKGSPGSHNGVISVTGSLGTQEFPRVRIGIHPGHPLSSGKDFVLSHFTRQQKKELDELLDRAADAVSLIIAEGVEKAMTAYNRRAPGSNKEEA